MKKRPLLEILLGTVLIAAPAVLPELPILNSPKVYAQGEKRDLEELISEKIKELEQKKDKTTDEYIRLIDLMYDALYYADEILHIIKEAQGKIKEKNSQYKYLEAMYAWIDPISWIDKAISIKKELIKDKKADPRIRSNAVIRFNFKNEEPDFHLAVKLDKTNPRAYLGLFDTYHKEINDYDLENKSESKIMSELRSFFSKYKRDYKKAIDLSHEVEYPEKFVYASRFHKIFSELMIQISHFTIGFGDSFRKKCMKLANTSCDTLLNISHTFENYMLKGYIHLWEYKLLGTHKQSLKEIKRYETAIEAYDNALKLAKTKIEKAKANIYKGMSCYEKGRCMDKKAWFYYATPEQKKYAKQAQNCIKEGLKTPEIKNHMKELDFEFALTRLKMIREWVLRNQ